MSQELATRSELPSYLQQYKATAEDINRDEIKIPMLKVAQGQSSEVIEGIADMGEFVDSITRETYGSSVKAVIIKPFINWVWFANKEDVASGIASKARELLGKSDNGTTWQIGKLAGQQIDEDTSYLYKKYNFYVMLIDKNGNIDPIPHLLSLGGKSAKEAGKLYQVLATDILKANRPCFAKTYEFVTKMEQNDSGSFYVVRWSQLEGYTSEDHVKVAASARDFINKTSVKIEEEQF